MLYVRLQSKDENSPKTREESKSLAPLSAWSRGINSLFLLAFSRVYPNTWPAAKGLWIHSTGGETFSLCLGDLQMKQSGGLQPPPRECLMSRTKVDNSNTGSMQLFQWVSYRRNSPASMLCLAQPITLMTPYGHWMGCDSIKAGNKQCSALHSEVFGGICIFH